MFNESWIKLKITSAFYQLGLRYKFSYLSSFLLFLCHYFLIIKTAK